MENLIEFVKPDLVLMSIALYLVGISFKKADFIKNKYIPLLLGGIGILAAGMCIFSQADITSFKDILKAAYETIIQGIMVAGLSNYANQIVKQFNKKD